MLELKECLGERIALRCKVNGQEKTFVFFSLRFSLASSGFRYSPGRRNAKLAVLFSDHAYRRLGRCRSRP